MTWFQKNIKDCKRQCPMYVASVRENRDHPVSMPRLSGHCFGDLMCFATYSFGIDLCSSTNGWNKPDFNIVQDW